jgi:PBSX family phage terminase large subunit
MLDLDALPLSRKQAWSIGRALTSPQLSVWTGAVASGKTVASLVAFLMCVAAAPDSGLIVMCGWTLQSIERNLIDPLMDERIFGALAAQVHHTAGSGVAVILGKTVHLVGASDSRAEARIRGATIALAYIDEATLIPETFWVMMLSRLRVPGARLLATTNPAGPGHWLRRDFIGRAAEVGMRTWHFTLDDNPFLSAEFVARLKRQYVGLFYKRYILGQWVAAEGVVFDMFDAERHVVDVLPVMKRWPCCGIDVGTVNPTAAIVLGLGIDRRLYAVAEWYWDSRARQRQLTDLQQSAKLREFFASVRHPGSQLYGIRPERIIVDPSAASFIRQLWADKALFDGGLSVMGADNAVIDGIRLVSSLVATGRLLVHKSCANLVDQMQSYSWDKKAAERGEDKPEKRNDHAVDALRYGIKTTHQLWRGELVPAEAPRLEQDYFSAVH